MFSQSKRCYGCSNLGEDMLQEAENRNEYIDYTKAIGICLVVLGHSFGGGLLALKTYHMPLFFFLSIIFYIT